MDTGYNTGSYFLEDVEVDEGLAILQQWVEKENYSAIEKDCGAFLI